MGGQAQEGPGQGAFDDFRVLGLAQGDDHHVARGALGDDQDGGAVARAHDQIGLPMAGHRAAFDLGRALADVDRAGQQARELGTRAGGGAAPGLLASQMPN